MTQRSMAAIAIASWRPFGIAVLSPAVAILSAGILVGLLGIFVLWLTVVATLVAAIVLTDLAHGLMRRIARPPIGSLDQRAMGVTGRS
jgi:membrane protein implicated in regulation of membrane protease activity